MPVPIFKEIHIENTNSCGYKCAMCPRESHTRQVGFMTVDDFSVVMERVRGVRWTDEREIFHLHGFGEPLLDRQMVPKIELLKKNFPKAFSLIFSTLGVRVADDYFEKLLGAGLTNIVVSFYGFTRVDYKQIHGNDGFERAKENLKNLSQAMKRFPHSFHGVIKVPGKRISSSLPVAEPLEKTEFCNWAKEAGFEVIEWTYVHNYGDGRTYNIPNEEKICPVLNGKRREILNVTWDLSVIPCCFDYNATIPFGNLRENSLEEIFASPDYLAFLVAHQTGNLSAYPVCQNCEKNDYF